MNLIETKTVTTTITRPVSDLTREEKIALIKKHVLPSTIKRVIDTDLFPFDTLLAKAVINANFDPETDL